MNGNEKNETRHELLNKVRMACFACIETNLFLDTHPNDREALKALKEYENEKKTAIKKYEERFGPLFAGDVEYGNEKYEWVKSPFPWEKECK